MKFKYIGPTDIVDGEEVPVNSYGGNKVKFGGIVELDGFLAGKAMKNPNYEEVKGKKPGPKKKVAAKVVEIAETREEQFGPSTAKGQGELIGELID